MSFSHLISLQYNLKTALGAKEQLQAWALAIDPHQVQQTLREEQLSVQRFLKDRQERRVSRSRYPASPQVLLFGPKASQADFGESLGGEDKSDEPPNLGSPGVSQVLAG